MDNDVNQEWFESPDDPEDFTKKTDSSRYNNTVLIIY